MKGAGRAGSIEINPKPAGPAFTAAQTNLLRLKDLHVKRLHVFVLAAASIAVSAAYPLRAADRLANALTIYSSAQPGAISPDMYRNGQPGNAVPGYAVVRHEREIELKSGRNEVRFADVAGLIDPTTVSVQSLTDPIGTRVVEQNFQFDLVSTDKLLHKFIDRSISVEQARGDRVETYSGTLLSTHGGLVLRQDDGSVRVVNQSSGITLPDLPGGLITRPTLVWDVSAGKAGKHVARVVYQTNGITWWADYNLTYSEGADANSCKLNVGAW